MTHIAVTGASGHVGGAVARRLASTGDHPVTVVVRDAARVPDVAGVEVAVASYHDGPAVARALARTDVVLMVSAAEHADRVQQHRTFVEAAVRAGVSHIVYTSFVGADDATTFTLGRDHGATEQAIRDSGLDYTFLRANFYLDSLLEFGDENGVIRGPAGTGRAAAVARADVAEAATSVLRHPEDHRKTVYDLTGPEAISLPELAARASAASGRSYRFVDETIDEAYASRAHVGAPRWQLDAWVSTYTAIAAGELARVSDDVRRLTGHDARSLEDVVGCR